MAACWQSPGIEYIYLCCIDSDMQRADKLRLLSSVTDLQKPHSSLKTFNTTVEATDVWSAGAAESLVLTTLVCQAEQAE